MLLSLLFGVAAAGYNEALTMQPLANSMLFTQFQFSAQQPAPSPEFPEYTLFPRSLGQILDHTHTTDLHLRFSQGWWDHESWGTEPNNGNAAGGIGVELWAYVGGESEEDALTHWYTLVHSLSGLFCASLNFIDVQNTAFPASDRYLLRGALPGEPVCTENLTPFLKLLPCKGWSGIASLLDGHTLFDSQWQTMALDVRVDQGVYELNQSIASVINVPRLLSRRESPLPIPKRREELNCLPGHAGCMPQKAPTAQWLMSDIFGKPMAGKCPLADNSILSINAPGWTIENEDNKLSDKFELGDSHMNIRLSGPVDSLAPISAPPITVDRSFTGAGQQDGGVRVVFTNNEDVPVTLQYFEALPWYMRTYLHTLKDPQNVVKDLHYVGSQIRGRPTQFELEIELPPNSQASLEYQFDKSLLFIEEYPPDANHGFEIPPGLVVTSSGYKTRTTSLLLSLPVPDFSMPYNVIILTSTVMTLPFGNILNMLIKVVIPETVGERFASSPIKSAVSKVKGLFK